MSAIPPLSHDLALRIGLAARALPDSDPRHLMTVLTDAIGLPFTEKKLSHLSLHRLRQAAGGELESVSLPALKLALDYLTGRQTVEIRDDTLLSVQAYEPGDMPGSVRVAVASNGGERIDGHFGSCLRFLIYQVAPAEVRLIAVRVPAPASDKSDRNRHRADLIADCDLLYAMSVGGPAAAKVIQVKVHPVKFPFGGEAREALAETQRVLRSGPPPWLAKVAGRRQTAV